MNAQNTTSTKDKDILTEILSVPLDGIGEVKLEINPGDGNIEIRSLDGGQGTLLQGELDYFEKRGRPANTMKSSGQSASLTLRGGGQARPWFRMPWSACNGATDWLIQLNSEVHSDISARTGGGNIILDLTGLTVGNILAETGGGNLEITLPEQAGNFSLTAKTGAGAVKVNVPASTAARIRATTGLGQVVVDPRFCQTEKFTYQSPDFDRAANKVEITAGSGAGAVIIETY